MIVHVLRDGNLVPVDAKSLVPGDVLVIEEGDRICADGRLIDGSIQVDLSMLNGESRPATRSADLLDISGRSSRPATSCSPAPPVWEGKAVRS